MTDSRTAPRISVFPKCYFDELYTGRMDYLEWLRQAGTLGAEGVEHYDGFFKMGVAPVRQVLQTTGQISSMLCFSPDFTHPDAGERACQVERQKAAVDLCVRLGISHCRTLSGQRHPGMDGTLREGVGGVLQGGVNDGPLARWRSRHARVWERRRTDNAKRQAA